jgi:hypothetical protein
MGTQPIHPGQELVLELPYSEVCMHLRVAGTRMRARLLPNGMVQLLQPDGREFSFPITAGEAGLHHDHDGWHRVAADPPEPPADQPAPNRSPTGDQHRAALEALSEPLAIEDPRVWRGDVIPGPGGPLYWHPELGYLAVPDPESGS